MKATILVPFRDKNDRKVVYAPGDVKDFDNDRVVALAARGLVKPLETPKEAEADTEADVKPDKGKGKGKGKSSKKDKEVAVAVPEADEKEADAEADAEASGDVEDEISNGND